LIVTASILWLAWQKPAGTARADTRLRQLTTNSSDNRIVSSALSPDGHFLAYADMKGMHVRVVGSDDSQTMPQPEALRGEKIIWDITSPAWFPDGTRFVATSHPAVEDWTGWNGYQTGWSSATSAIWVFSVSGGAPQKLRDAARAWFVSPDGTISFGTNKGRLGERELWVMDLDGGRARKVLEVDDARSLCCLYTFKGGARIAFSMTDDSGETLLTRELRGGPVATLIPPSVMKTIPDLVWLTDGRLIYSDGCNFAQFDATCTYWSERFDISSGRLVEKPRHLTHVSGVLVCCPSVAADGRLMTFQQTQESGTARPGCGLDLHPQHQALHVERER
jgi:Tol biopolymer transport system component